MQPATLESTEIGGQIKQLEPIRMLDFFETNWNNIEWKCIDLSVFENWLRAGLV